ncbi:MAG: WD40 repeat domain-containing protein, partial [Chloroflexota bacterium]
MKRINYPYAQIILCLILSACNVQSPAGPAPVVLSPSVMQTPTIMPMTTTAQIIEQANWKADSTQIGKGAIISGEFSPDGKRFATVTPLGIAIYAADTLQQLDFISADPPVLAAAFSPDWSAIATGRGATVTVLRLEDKQVISRFITEKGIVYRLLFSPDGSLLASFAKPPGDEVYSEIVELWRIRDGKLLTSWQVSIYDQAFFAPDGKTFYAWNVSQMAGVRRWQIPSGAALPAWTDLNPYPQAFSPDGKLYAATINAAIMLGHTADKTRMLKLPIAQTDTAYQLRFSPDSSLLLGWFMDGMLRVWRTDDGSQLNSFDAGPPAVRFLAISPDNKTIAFPFYDGIAFYSLADGSLLRRLDNHISAIFQAVISPQGNRAAALVEGDGLMVWDLPGGNLRYSLSKTGAIGMAWLPDGQWLVLGGWDGSLRILRAADGEMVRSIPAHSEQVQSVAFSPDGSLLASSSMESVKVWKVSDESLQRDSPSLSLGQSYSLPGGWVPKVIFSHDGKYLAASSANGKVRVWQTSSEKVVAELPVPNLAGDREVIDFSLDGSYLAIGEMSQIDLWRYSEPKPFVSLPTGDAKIITLRISPDGTLLVCGLTDGAIQFWQIPKGELIRTIQGGSEGIASLDFSANGWILLSAS